MALSRRRWLQAAATGLGTGALARAQKALPLDQFEPKSMLHAPEHPVPRARFPVIDFHSHLSWSGGLGKPAKPRMNATPEEILAVMDRRNIQTMVNLTGGSGDALQEAINYWQKPRPERFFVFTEPAWNRTPEPGYPQWQADELKRGHDAGARGIKVLKTLGLYLRDQVTTGKLIAVDDRRFDPFWEQAAALKMPIAIHTGDPEAFFLPIDRHNERFEELNAHPDWSFHGRDFPSFKELHEARNRVVARHPRTQFVVLHVGDAENLPWVSTWLDQYPNMHVEIGARIGELGRQPRAAKRFFDRYQDRILFGTDAVPKGVETPQQVFNDQLYEIYYRFLETEDEYFDYAPASKPPQGRWSIYGLGLSENILRKVYHDNAARLLQRKTIA